MPQSAQAAISRYPVPALEAMPEDIRVRILKVQEKSGFIPNVFLMLAYRPDEFVPHPAVWTMGCVMRRA
jgi:hypothetical protein